MNYTEKGTLILDGKTVAKDIQNSIKNRIDGSNLEITLVTVLVGMINLVNFMLIISINKQFHHQ